jgi:hypothetical protein
VNHGCYGYPYAPITASFAHSAMLRSLRHGSRLAVIVAAVLATVLRRVLGQSPVSVACFFQAASYFYLEEHWIPEDYRAGILSFQVSEGIVL